MPFDKKNAEKLSQLTSKEENNWGFKVDKYGRPKSNSLVNIEIILERDPILQDTVGPNASAKSDQPPAWRTLLSIETPNRKERPTEERPGGRVGLPLILYPSGC